MATNRRGGHRVQEVTTSGFGGTGPVQLNGTPDTPKGRRTFVSEIGDTNLTVYEIDDSAGNWERGIGTVSSGSPDTISRDAVIDSSAGGAKVNFSAGQKDVYIPFGVDDMPGVRSVSSNTTLTAADHNILVTVDASGGSRTITLPPAADAGNGFLIYVKKTDSSGNAVTIDGDSAETIDGQETFDLVFQYDVVTLRGSGTEWLVEHASVKPIFTSFTSNGTWNRTAGRRYADIDGVAGGGGGGGLDSSGEQRSGSGGGGGGAFEVKGLDISGIASSTITVGSGGTGGEVGVTAPGNGGDTSWSDGTNTFTAGGGQSGANDNSGGFVNGGSGGSASGSPDVTLPGQDGARGLGNSGTRLSGAGGNAGGRYGGAGGPVATNQAGDAGNNYGGGGSGAEKSAAGGEAGGPGAGGFLGVVEYV